MSEVAFWGYGLAALLYGGFGLYAFVAWRGGVQGAVLLVAVLASCLWAAANAALAYHAVPVTALSAVLLDVVRSGAWYGFLLVLLLPLGAARSRWPVSVAIAIVVAQIAALALVYSQGSEKLLPMSPVLAAWLAHGVFGLILVEQLYRTVPSASRWGIKPLCLALGAGYIFELYLFADALLFGRLDQDVWAVRGIAHAIVVPLIAISGSRNPSWTLRMSISREMVFHSTALAASGLYLLVIAAAAYYVRYFGGAWGRALQMTLLFAGLVLLGVVLFSGAQRARLRVFVSKHLFPYRYDYRNEWRRFTESLSSAEGGLDLGQSVIRALADLVESPGGAVWLKRPDGAMVMRFRYNHPACDGVEPSDSPLCRFLGEREWIVNLEEFRGRPGQYQGLVIPPWLSKLAGAWLIVPLTGGGGLIGFVVLNAPRAPFEIDWEVLDLLKSAQRQAASYLDRMLAAEALLEARKFDSFNRMSAFVVHDLKNLVAQLSLMLKNAQRHKDNPEFQQDMLETVAHVESRMRGLMQQLQEKRSIDPPRVVSVPGVLEKVVRAKRVQRPELGWDGSAGDDVLVHAHPERLERILGHLVQNALDATSDDGRVMVRVEALAGGLARIIVEDDGCGMSEAFLRERLSRPFETTKSNGMGIGVFETQQYVSEIGGRLQFHSEEGRGTTVSIELPRIERGEAEKRSGVLEGNA
ncbi:MAG: PEP-CTERM system histidine kinase PrsK [Thauera phenolivorans]|uniref:histidine kinase n=1 Tax=Thauera phenolivorans TaxID=1792543 RepID=A0A7X7LXV9_9RHOO|nr:PEP-CTERM system histidine kinase PrsK [Thauera phenolivorans]